MPESSRDSSPTSAASTSVAAATVQSASTEAPEDTSCGFSYTLLVVLMFAVCGVVACKRHDLSPVAMTKARFASTRPDNIYLSSASDDTAGETASLTSSESTDHNPLQQPTGSVSLLRQHR